MNYYKAAKHRNDMHLDFRAQIMLFAVFYKRRKKSGELSFI